MATVVPARGTALLPQPDGSARPRPRGMAGLLAGQPVPQLGAWPRAGGPGSRPQLRYGGLHAGAAHSQAAQPAGPGWLASQLRAARTTARGLAATGWRPGQPALAVVRALRGPRVHEPQPQGPPPRAGGPGCRPCWQARAAGLCPTAEAAQPAGPGWLAGLGWGQPVPQPQGPPPRAGGPGCRTCWLWYWGPQHPGAATACYPSRVAAWPRPRGQASLPAGVAAVATA